MTHLLTVILPYYAQKILTVAEFGALMQYFGGGGATKKRQCDCRCAGLCSTLDCGW